MWAIISTIAVDWNSCKMSTAFREEAPLGNPKAERTISKVKYSTYQWLEFAIFARRFFELEKHSKKVVDNETGKIGDYREVQ